MNTPSLTSEQVLAWLHEQAAASGIKGVEIIATTNGVGYIARVNDPCYQSRYADTVEQAIGLLSAALPTVEKLAEEKRAEAAKLLAEAEALTAALVSA